MANAATEHLATALRWSPGRDGSVVEALAAGLAMAVPVAVGAASGHLALGLAAAVGALVVNDVVPGPNARAHLRRLAVGFAPAGAACVAAMLVAGHGGITDTLVVVLAAAAATLGGASRGLAVFAMRFVLAFVLIINATEASAGGAHSLGLFVVILVGSLTTAAINLVFGIVFGLGLGLLPGPHRQAGSTSLDPGQGPAARATAAQKYARWRRTLVHRAAWQYPVRLAGCLALAAVARHAWPGHHFTWISLVVAILTQRQLERLPLKTTQRVLGTVLGVAAAGLVVVYRPPIGGLIVGIGVLAALRPVLKVRNYLAYTALMTPLIMLIMDANQPLGAGVLLDRLAATVIAAGLVLVANWLAARWLTDPAGPASPRAAQGELVALAAAPADITPAARCQSRTPIPGTCADVALPHADQPARE